MTAHDYHPPKMWLVARIGGAERVVAFTTADELVAALRAVPPHELRPVVIDLCNSLARLVGGMVSWGDFHSATDALVTFAATLAQFEMGAGDP